MPSRLDRWGMVTERRQWMAHDLACITEFSMELQVHMEADRHRCLQPPTLTQPLGRHPEERQRLTPWARME